MQKIKFSLIAFIMAFSFSQTSFAQEGMEDVLYLKNGNIYRGLIIEQVPGESLKIKTTGGNVFSVTIAELQKITKEDKVREQPAYRGGYDEFQRPYWAGRRDSSNNKFQRKKRGYFFKSQLLIEAVQGGARIVNGYRFNRFAQLGVGVGLDFVIASPSEIFRNFYGDDFRGNYLPLYLYFSGDVLNKRVTPFYAIEAGYAWRFGGDRFPFNGGGLSSSARGGIMGGAGLGVKFYTKRRVHFSLLLNANFKNVRYTATYTEFDQNGNAFTVTERVRRNLIFPGLRFGIGF